MKLREWTEREVIGVENIVTMPTKVELRDTRWLGFQLEEEAVKTLGAIKGLADAMGNDALEGLIHKLNLEITNYFANQEK